MRTVRGSSKIKGKSILGRKNRKCEILTLKDTRVAQGMMRPIWLAGVSKKKRWGMTSEALG